MPDTATEAAKLAGLEYDEKRLKTDPEYNKALGLAYFKKQVDDFKDNRLAIMAYNAGPGRVNEWIAEYGDPRNGDITIDEFIDKVPYKETRNYIKSISKRLVADAN
jgi:soluble lytic murein transglycosylase-like protein